jgi:ABC-2 type transport system ATP-binding protein
MLEQIGLEGRADEEVGRLSGGNQQRVNIGIGLLCEPAVLLLDEPSASLDPRQRERLWEFIGGLAGRGTTVVYSTHNVVEAERYADRVLVLVDGELLFTGTPRELEQAVAADDARAAEQSAVVPDFESAFVSFLRARGH